MTFQIRGPQEWSMTRDSEGHRQYKLVTFVESNDYNDGPTTALLTPGLPLPGAPWFIGNDIDIWAWCRWDANVTPAVTNEPNRHFRIEQMFGTKPLPKDQQRPDSIGTPIENPLLESPKVSGSYIKVSEETSIDRFGQFLFNSAWELFRGPQVEFDVTRSTIKVEQNFATMNFPLNEAMMNCVNDAPLWGYPARVIKLSGISWDRKFHGYNFVYYTRTLEFEINRNGWDRVLLDEATKVLNGKWTTDGLWQLVNINGSAPNSANPTHFKRAKDRDGNYCTMVLNGRGLPASTVVVTPNDVANLGALFISIVSSNTGSALTNAAKWLQMSRVGLESAWNGALEYPVGSLAFYDNQFYIALQVNTNIPPNINDLIWRKLTNGITDKGSYSASTTYSLGDRVQYPLSNPTGIGQRYVSKYPGANFLALSVPLIF